MTADPIARLHDDIAAGRSCEDCEPVVTTYRDRRSGWTVIHTHHLAPCEDAEPEVATTVNIPHQDGCLCPPCRGRLIAVAYRNTYGPRHPEPPNAS